MVIVLLVSLMLLRLVVLHHFFPLDRCYRRDTLHDVDTLRYSCWLYLLLMLVVVRDVLMVLAPGPGGLG